MPPRRWKGSSPANEVLGGGAELRWTEAKIIPDTDIESRVQLSLWTPETEAKAAFAGGARRREGRR